ncbi:MAG: hypothetical protein JRH11_04430, partial [Deltaproteobacteria bacterium]|nr:hypothetical protein [Deltaproteobacteria bacterium]
LITLAELDGSRGAGALADAQSAYELDPYSFRANLYLAEDALSRRDEAALAAHLAQARRTRPYAAALRVLEARHGGQ